MRLPVLLPSLAEGVEKAELVLIRVKPGDRIEAGDILFDVETEKASVPIPSPASGTVTEIHVREGETLAVGALMLTLEAEEAEIPSGIERPSPTPALSPPVREAEAEIFEEEKPAGPGVRRLARELGVDLREVRGTGTEGRIREEDVRRHEAPLPDFSRWGPIRRVPLSPLRRTISENVSRAWNLIPHVHQFHEANITELETLHRRYKERFQKEGVHLTLTAFLLPAVVRTLKRFPPFNASLDPEAGELILKDYYHIGVAVDTEAGLIVPVLRDLSRKSLLEISRELEELAQRARDRKVSIEELQGGTFSLSNLGGIAGSHFTAIIRHPEVAVLGVGRARDRAVVREKTVTARRYLPLCLGYDHRVIDGAEGARFLGYLVEILEDYEGFLLGL